MDRKLFVKIIIWNIAFVVILLGLIIAVDNFGHRLPVLVSNTVDVLPEHVYNQTRFYKAVNCSHALNLSENTNTNLATISATRKPQKRVAFLKVHKAGSTTMQNLFFRFAIRHKLNILLPRSGHSLWKTSSKMPIKLGQHYDIFACHTVYSKNWFDSLLPGDSVNIGIVREPVSRMTSAAYYFRDVWRSRYLKKVPPVNFIHNLVNFPEKYDTAFFSKTKNAMGADFGFKSDTNPENTVQIKKYLDDLNKHFLLVLVMEKFDESLVMMKRLLNWSLVDILYLKTNSHAHKSIVLNETETEKFRRTSFLDFEIYEYFTKVFETKLQQVDNSFSDELNFFKTVLEQVRKFCLKPNKAENATLVIQSSQWNNEFKVSNLECEWMGTKELPFIYKLRKTHLYSQ